MQHVDTIIKARWILTVNPQDQILTDHALLIQAGKISGFVPHQAVGQTVNAKEIIDLGETHALLPGFVNAHTHGAMNLLRGLADDLSLLDWLQNYIWPTEAQVVSPEFVRDGLLHACAEMLRGGTTCFNDNYFFVGEAAQVVAEVGMRAVLSEAFFVFPVPWSQHYEEGIQRSLDTYQTLKNHALINIALAPHAPYSTDEQLLRRIKTLSEQHQMLIHMHMHEGRSEVPDYQAKFGARPLAHYDALGLLSNQWLNVHMCDCSLEDMELLKKYQMSVIHCPESNMKLASGYCPADALIKAGINVALGTDGAASNNDLDMIGEMRSACFLAKAHTGNPIAISANDALRMATINGAKALKLDTRIGSLEVGKDADISAIDLSSIETEPLYHPIPQIVYAGSRKDISHVWVKGKILLRDKQLTSINLAEVKQKIRHWHNKILQLAANKQ
jgi:5-methylthioadenosine/S-adenosylhomocysteine deaminase